MKRSSWYKFYHNSYCCYFFPTSLHLTFSQHSL